MATTTTSPNGSIPRTNDSGGGNLYIQMSNFSSGLPSSSSLLNNNNNIMMMMNNNRCSFRNSSRGGGGVVSSSNGPVANQFVQVENSNNNDPLPFPTVVVQSPPMATSAYNHPWDFNNKRKTTSTVIHHIVPPTIPTEAAAVVATSNDDEGDQYCAPWDLKIQEEMVKKMMINKDNKSLTRAAQPPPIPAVPPPIKPDDDQDDEQQDNDEYMPPWEHRQSALMNGKVTNDENKTTTPPNNNSALNNLFNKFSRNRHSTRSSNEPSTATTATTSTTNNNNNNNNAKTGTSTTSSSVVSSTGSSTSSSSSHHSTSSTPSSSSSSSSHHSSSSSLSQHSPKQQQQQTPTNNHTSSLIIATSPNSSINNNNNNNKRFLTSSSSGLTSQAPPPLSPASTITSCSMLPTGTSGTTPACLVHHQQPTFLSLEHPHHQQGIPVVVTTLLYPTGNKLTPGLMAGATATAPGTSAGMPQIVSIPAEQLQHLFMQQSLAQQLDGYIWYHGRVTRKEAEMILNDKPVGSFLVRQSESGNSNDFSLSLVGSGCVHMRICMKNGMFILGQCSQPFPTIVKMIEHYGKVEVPIKGAQHVRLLYPVPPQPPYSTSTA